MKKMIRVISKIVNIFLFSIVPTLIIYLVITTILTALGY